MKEKQAKPYTIEAPCKVNLHLKIGKKRPDGFHDIESLFVTLGLADTLLLEESGDKGRCNINIEWNLPEKYILELPSQQEVIPLGENLVFKAVSLFRENTCYENGLNICLTKRIPAGSGLGGGSSDAASTLLALNSMTKSGLSMEKLAKMALNLGSDVPFFLFKGIAFVSGKGEIIEPVKLPFNFSRKKLWVLLVKPPFSINTAAAYKALDEAREAISLPGKARKNIPRGMLIGALEKNPENWPYYNDFLPVLLASKDNNGKNALCFNEILENLKKKGAVFTGLSGSGSSCFGIFTAMEKAEKAEKELSGHGNFTKITFFLA